ncbi:MAG: type 4a pilus biogenesis protein PilO [Candidatus Eisenbacteria sp.]|nr:type 4a pilus biogenesis protein PilO [Candidatus Eisenbacteria bacterium]
MTDPRKVDVLGRLAVMLCVATFVLLVVHQGIRPLLHARRNLGSFRQAAEILTDAQGMLDRLAGEIQIISGQIAAGETQLPPEPNLEDFLDRLETAAQQNGVRIERLTPSGIIPHALYRQQNIDVRISGAFLQLHGLLGVLEEADQLSRIEELRITSAAPGGPCAAELRLALYFSPREG